MVYRKIIKLNNKGAKGVSIPANLLIDLGLDAEDSYVNITKVGNSLHMNPVREVL